MGLALIKGNKSKNKCSLETSLWLCNFTLNSKHCLSTEREEDTLKGGVCFVLRHK